MGVEKGTVSVAFAHPALKPVYERGMDVERLLHDVGISPALLQNPNGRISAQNYSALWLHVAEVLDDELFGQDARRMKVGTFAMLCFTLVHCDTLRSALNRMAKCFNLVLDDFHCEIETTGTCRLTIRQKNFPKEPRVFGFETLLMLQHGVACWLVGRRVPILEAGFCYPEPEHSGEYRVMYSENLHFDREVTYIAFDRSNLDLPVVQNERTLKDFVRNSPANIVLKYKNRDGFAALIRRRLRTASRNDWPDFDEFASTMNMTPSTLRRRLADEGQSFQGIKDELRRDMAIEALSHSGKSVMEIALELGFGDASAFHRAFKKWTGAGPGTYRQRLRPSE